MTNWTESDDVRILEDVSAVRWAKDHCVAEILGLDAFDEKEIVFNNLLLTVRVNEIFCFRMEHI